MSNLAYKYQQQKQYVEQPQPSTRKLFTRKITKGEKALWALALIALLVTSVYVVSTYATIYSLNRDTQQMQEKIEAQKKANSELQQEVSQLSKPSRIYKQAKQQGLVLDPDQVKFLENR